MTASRDYVMDVARRYQRSLLVQHAFVSGLLRQLTTQRSVDDVARARGWERATTRALLDALTALGVLTARDGLYELAARVAPVVAADAASSLDGLAEHKWRQQALWDDLDRVVHATAPLPLQQDYAMAQDPERLAALLRAMRQVGRDMIEFVGEMPEWDDRRHVLDVGGGHGEILCSIARRRPELRGTVVDQAYARPVAQETFELYGVGDRLGFVVRDLSDDDCLAGLEADGILIARVLHNFAPDRIRAVLASTRRVLDPGGVLVISENKLEERDGRLVPAPSAAFSAYISVNCAGGWVPDEQWMLDELRALGAIARVDTFARDHALYVARW